MSLMQRIKLDQLAARKEKNAVKTSVLTTLLGEATAIGKNDGNRETTDAEVVVIVKKFINNIDFVLSKVDSGTAVDTANAEKEILSEYLPEQITGDRLTCVIQDMISEIGSNSKANMGKIMGMLKKEFSGKYDGAEASALLKTLLQ